MTSLILVGATVGAFLVRGLAVLVGHVESFVAGDDRDARKRAVATVPIRSQFEFLPRHGKKSGDDHVRRDQRDLLPGAPCHQGRVVVECNRNAPTVLPPMSDSPHWSPPGIPGRLRRPPSRFSPWDPPPPRAGFSPPGLITPSPPRPAGVAWQPPLPSAYRSGSGAVPPIRRSVA